MKQNNSPWLTQLDHERKINTLEKDTAADVVIIGGGIAGVTTLYFLLKHTNKKIALLEGHLLGHGATGHNAGQVVAEFERPLPHLAKEYGIKKAVEGFTLMENAWELLTEIFEDTQIDIPFKEFIGYSGYTEQKPLLEELETELIKSQQGLVHFPTLVSRESGWMAQIPKKFHSICMEVEGKLVTELLEVKVSGYHAVIPNKAATLNSALFSERLAMWCLEKYPERASLFEKSFVQGIELQSEKPLIFTDLATVSCDEVVLCTNGFENFYIHDKEGLDIDAKFHHLVQGVVGYMTGYLTQKELPPMASRYYADELKGEGEFQKTRFSDIYFYITQRKFGTEADTTSLLAIGGPEVGLVEREIYFKEFDVPEKMRDDAVAFANKYFKMDQFDQKFFWHGLMGYTRTGVRVVGREPVEPRLMYNLGCNGVGILPSIMGAKKIAQHVNNEQMEDTIFDPKR
jgi:glycine/D-amino acid oxidase-like deaminating enzyme